LHFIRNKLTIKGGIVLELNVLGRGEGKTTKVIERMVKDKSLILIIPFKHMKRSYPRELQYRIYTFDEFKLGKTQWSGTKKIILDEGLLYPRSTIAELYFYLGSNDFEVISYGTE
jgi:hypothetical protein